MNKPYCFKTHKRVCYIGKKLYKIKSKFFGTGNLKITSSSFIHVSVNGDKASLFNLVSDVLFLKKIFDLHKLKKLFSTVTTKTGSRELLKNLKWYTY